MRELGGGLLDQQAGRAAVALPERVGGVDVSEHVGDRVGEAIGILRANIRGVTQVVRGSVEVVPDVAVVSEVVAVLAQRVIADLPGERVDITEQVPVDRGQVIRVESGRQ
nr:hypothetical protein [Tsukamurella paurometabola]